MNDCICLLPCQDGTATLREGIRTARKVHVCGECHEEIQPGQQYEYVIGVTYGDMWSAKTCMSCVRIRDDLFQCGWYYGDIWADIHARICRDEDDGFCLCPPLRSLVRKEMAK